MIKAVIFDLDGTLVQTEKLKAISYARAAVKLCPNDVTEEEVVDAYREVVGRSRQEVAQYLMERFGLEKQVALRMEEVGVNVPWQAFAQMRLQIYEKMVADPNVLLSHQWPHNMALLERVNQGDWSVGLATMSQRVQVEHVLNVLGLMDVFDFVATRDDVDKPKPDPEIYLLVAHELMVRPEECLVVEDSLPGVQAALAAGMAVIAVTTPFTRLAFQQQDLLDRRWVVDEPDKLSMLLGKCLENIDTVGALT